MELTFLALTWEVKSSNSENVTSLMHQNVFVEIHLVFGVETKSGTMSWGLKGKFSFLFVSNYKNTSVWRRVVAGESRIEI